MPWNAAIMGNGVLTEDDIYLTYGNLQGAVGTQIENTMYSSQILSIMQKMIINLILW